MSCVAQWPSLLDYLPRELRDVSCISFVCFPVVAKTLSLLARQRMKLTLEVTGFGIGHAHRVLTAIWRLIPQSGIHPRVLTYMLRPPFGGLVR